jgi:hypothetical protein
VSFIGHADISEVTAAVVWRIIVAGKGRSDKWLVFDVVLEESRQTLRGPESSRQSEDSSLGGGYESETVKE